MDMKISEILSSQLNEVKAAREKKIQDDFNFTLNKLDDEGLAERLSGLIQDITVKGKKLSDHMDIKDLRGYRSLVKDFINEVVTHGHKFSRENYLDRRGRHRVYGIIKQVDKNLDDLAQELLKSEKDRIKILDKVDEVRGLLLDIMV